MDAHRALHPTDQTLSSYGLGKLDDGSGDAVNQHLEQCLDCRQRVAENGEEEVERHGARISGPIRVPRLTRR